MAAVVVAATGFVCPNENGTFDAGAVIVVDNEKPVFEAVVMLLEAVVVAACVFGDPNENAAKGDACAVVVIVVADVVVAV